MKLNKEHEKHLKDIGLTVHKQGNDSFLTVKLPKKKFNVKGKPANFQCAFSQMCGGSNA